MSTRMYTLPVEQTQWQVPGMGATTVFNWEYDEGRDKLLGLYARRARTISGTRTIVWTGQRR